MSHAFVTIVAPLALEKAAAAEQAIDAMGNPAKEEIRDRLDELDGDDGLQGTHFASLHAVRSPDGERAWLILEFSADGTEDDALRRIVQAIGDRLRAVFTYASDWRDGGDLLAYLRKRRVVPGCGWFSNPGAVFTGTPGMSVGRIRREAELAAHITVLVGRLPANMDALERVDAVRRELKKEFAAELVPGAAEAPFETPSTAALVGTLAWSFIKTYLWPAGLLLLAATLLGGAYYASRRGSVLAFFGGAGAGLIVAFFVILLVLVIAAVVGYGRLRRQENNDWLEQRSADRKTLAAMFERENQCAQNHMISITRRKPGIVRWFTARLVFWVIGELAANFYRPGFLSDIGTIHFARWVTVPNSRDLLFFSNYDSSWESYLEDFITRAHAGLTAVWSNSIGFPRAENLFQKGATDGERFKRYARHSMVPTRFWYSAYPALTTTIIRANADIRRGLSGVLTEDEAMRWLALFGSAARPAANLVNNEIQSLIFGGLRFMPFGVCVLLSLPEDMANAREWLRVIRPHIAFNDGRRLFNDGRPDNDQAVVTLALSAGGLQRLGLPEEGLSTFPFAFLEGMTAEYRARILGDRAAVDGKWSWDDQRFDVALLVYGKTAEAVKQLQGKILKAADSAGSDRRHIIPLVKVTDDKKEPFGFLDGVSQPIIRGTYKGLRNADPIHLVEPGEFILGYPDNRGSIPPGPTLPAIADPDNRLPLVGARDDFVRTQVENDRDLGKNGSFLVIRQLEQDVNGFAAYCEGEAKRLASRLPPPYFITADFIAAKLIGRWKDGSSLVRYPYEPRSSAQEQIYSHETVRPKTSPLSAAAPVEPPAKAAATPPKPGEPPPPSRAVADNDFLFGSEDPEALRCPFGAHIRRANPRDSLVPGSADQIAITNRHRIIRLGRKYEPEGTKDPGLLFMCLNGDIERQFEFVQQTWLKSPSFHGLSCEKDPLLGDAEEGLCAYTIPSREGPMLLNSMPAFVKTKGGGYFFLPGMRLIDYLVG
jgi:deferrochelatase/peroxidase EfeB